MEDKRLSDYNNPQYNVPQPSPLDPKELVIEMGGTGTALVRGFLSMADYNQDLTGRNRIDIYDQMLKGDASIRAMFMAVTLPIVGAEWYVQKGDSQEIADFIDDNLFNKMDTTFTTFLRQAMYYLAYGSYRFEKVFKVTDDGKLMWKKFAPRLPKTILRYTMKDGITAGITQILPMGAQTEIPEWKLLNFVNEQDGLNYEGLSIFRSAYKHWYMKDKMYMIDAIATERQGLGIPFAHTPPNMKDEERNKLVELLKNIRVNEEAYMIAPIGTDVEFMDMKIHSIKNPENMILHHDRQISKAVLAQFLELGGSKSGGGARALSEDHSDLFLMSLKAIANYIQEILNQAIRELVDLNFPNVKEYPTLEVGKIGVDNLTQIAENIAKLATVNMITPDIKTETHLRELLDLPEKDPDDYHPVDSPKLDQTGQPILKPNAIPAPIPGAPKVSNPKPLQAGESLIDDVLAFRNSIDYAITNRFK